MDDMQNRDPAPPTGAVCTVAEIDGACNAHCRATPSL